MFLPGDQPASEIFQLFTLEEQELGTGDRSTRHIYIPIEWISRFPNHDMEDHRPVIDFWQGWFNVDLFQHCEYCGEDHRAAITEFLDWYRGAADGTRRGNGFTIHKLSELQDRFVEKTGISQRMKEQARQEARREAMQAVEDDPEVQARVLEKLGLADFDRRVKELEALMVKAEAMGKQADKPAPVRRRPGRPRRETVLAA